MNRLQAYLKLKQIVVLDIWIQLPDGLGQLVDIFLFIQP